MSESDETRRRDRSKVRAPLQALPEVATAFTQLGCVAFGGPTAHLGYFQAELVEKRRWLDDQAYAEVVALCQILPGPSSSQVAFTLGMRRAGLLGALTASICFLLPSAVAMILFGYALALHSDVSGAGWLHGLKLAAVAVVASAVWGMALKLCPDWPRRSLGLGAAVAGVLFPGSFGQVATLAGCTVVGWLSLKPDPLARRPPVGVRPPRPAWAGAALFLFVFLLVALPFAASSSSDRWVAVVDSFYRVGSLVFGGGHVVLPLLRAEVVPRGWVSDGVFLAGYGAAQAVPGPLFSFAGFLGTVILPGPNAWLGGVLALVAIFLPGWLLVAGVYPYWRALQENPGTRAALKGTNAAVVGILLAALYRPLCTENITGLRDFLAAMGATVLLGAVRFPPWMLVAVMAAVGEWILR